METLYSDEVKKVIQSYDWPPGNRFIIHPRDGFNKQTGGTYLVLQIYRENFIQFDGVEQLRIAKIINQLIPRLNSMGIPTELRVEKGDGRSARG